MQKKILVVDDVELNQLLAKKMMESWGCEVFIVENGKKAVEIVQAGHYDLVLMDIQMPEMDGVEATIRIRQLKDKQKASIPIIALTANLLKGDNETYLAAGMNDYLSKPIDEKRLYDIIAKSLSLEPSNDFSEINSFKVQELPLYDLDLVKAISGGDENFVKNMVSLFLQTVPVSLEELKTSTKEADWAKAGRVAHKLKSTIDSMRINDLRDVIRDIENKGRKGDQVEKIPALVNEVCRVMEICMEKIRIDFAA